MANKNRKGIEFPKKFMKIMKKQKRKKIRKTVINIAISEKRFNNAAMEL